jgi:hypothetical protein
MILALRLWVKGVTTEFPYNRTRPYLDRACRRT